MNLQLNEVAAARFTVGDNVHAWVVGNRPGAGQPGTVLTTVDGGLTWAPQTTGVPNALPERRRLREPHHRLGGRQRVGGASAGDHHLRDRRHVVDGAGVGRSRRDQT